MTKMDELNERLRRVEDKLDLLLRVSQTTAGECTKMGDHIDWIESIYFKLRNPLRLILGRQLPSNIKSLN